MSQELEVSMKCVKYMLFVANFMFVMVAFLLISVGVTITGIYSDFELFMETYYFDPAQLIIATGCIMLFVSLFGCVGAIKESTCLVNTYAIFLSMVLVLEISAAIATYAMRANIEENITKRMQFYFDEYDTSDISKQGFDDTQYYLSCCGINGPADWDPEFNNSSNTLSDKIPKSCCASDGRNQCALFMSGCLDRLVYVISECALMLGVGALCVSFIQILGIVFAHLLAKSIRRIKTETLVEREMRRQALYEQLARGQDKGVVYTSQTEKN